jgi:predicted transcriptional regulator
VPHCGGVGPGACAASSTATTGYDKCMKRITVSLPDELAEQVKRAAGGERRVSSYVAAALEDYTEREDLEEVLASWNAETPVTEEVRRQIRGELDQVGFTSQPRRDDRLAG